MSEKAYAIQVKWDESAQVWVATSNDVAGLVTEAAHIDVLFKKLRVMVPELLEANGIIPKHRHARVDITLNFSALAQEPSK